MAQNSWAERTWTCRGSSGLGDLERPVAEGHLDDGQPGAGLEDVGLEGAEEVVAGPVADRVGDDGHDVEDVGHGLDVLLVVGAPAAGGHRLVLAIGEILEGHAAPGDGSCCGFRLPMGGGGTGRLVADPEFLSFPRR